MGSNQVVGVKPLFFHGFWGQALDAPTTTDGVEYTVDTLLGPEHFYSDWGQNFHQWKMEKFGKAPLKVVGYSQGGRLLLQALAQNPDDFESLVLISAHPGLQSHQEKEARLSHDRQWAQKFRTQSWSVLLNEWNSQSVFAGGVHQSRTETDFNRELLAQCFENWSLAHQPDFRQLIIDHIDKLHFVLGSEDSKYLQLYRSFLPDLTRLKIAKGAAHRVPSDQPELLVEILNSIF